MHGTLSLSKAYRLIAACLFVLLAHCAYAGPITWTSSPFFELGPAILGGNFLNDNPQAPLQVVALHDGFRVQGDLDFQATRRIVVILWEARRDFDVGHPEIDILRTSFDMDFWSNTSDTGLLGDWSDLTQATGIGAITIGAIDFAQIPQDPTVMHPPLPRCDQQYCGYNQAGDMGFDLVASPAGGHELLQFVALGFFVNDGDIVRLQFPVDSTIDPLPEPSAIFLLGTGLLGMFIVAHRNRRRKTKTP